MAVLTRNARGTRSEDVRKGNLSALLRYVHVHGPTARSRLTAELGLNRSTIGDLTGELVLAGLLREEAGRAQATGGRPSYVVVPETHLVQVLAIDVGVTHLTVARVGLGGQVLARRDGAYRRGDHGRAAVTSTITRVASELLAESPAGVIVGAGVAVPGMVRRRDGQVRQAPNLGWQDEPVATALQRQLGLPVAVANDADLGIRAEHVRGAAAGADDAVYLSGHSGIGAGIIAGGAPLGGIAGYAGEVGHASVNPDGLPCHCGSRGCWETECSEERLFQLAGWPAGGGVDGVRAVIAAATREDPDGPDPAAVAALDHVARWLGRGSALVVNALNPEVVILGGALAEILSAAGDTVRSEMQAAALAAPFEAVRLVVPALGPDSTLLGAAELAFESLLDDPLLQLPRRTAS